jgi:small subunit ribosomal protein S2
MSTLPMQDLLEAGMHFGHLTRRWNPKMKPFIYGVRNGIHIIDLSKTVKLFQEAVDFITDAVGNGANVLFVGTKKQAQDVIEEEAQRCKMYYVNHRWLGGTLTNFKTIKSSIERLKDLQKKKEDGTFSVLSKKEILMIDREIEKLLRSLGGIKDMERLPGIMVMVDPNLEHIALHEANVLGIPVIALADTNCDPDPIDYLVPGNDDALRSIKIFISKVADQVLQGLKLREARVRRSGEEKPEVEDKKAVREAAGEKAAAFVSRQRAEPEEEEEIIEGSYSAKAQVEPEEASSPEDEDKAED